MRCKQTSRTITRKLWNVSTWSYLKGNQTLASSINMPNLELVSCTPCSLMTLSKGLLKWEYEGHESRRKLFLPQHRGPSSFNYSNPMGASLFVETMYHLRNVLQLFLWGKPCFCKLGENMNNVADVTFCVLFCNHVKAVKATIIAMISSGLTFTTSNFLPHLFT